MRSRVAPRSRRSRRARDAARGGTPPHPRRRRGAGRRVTRRPRPRSHVTYVQYGVSFTGEFVADAGAHVRGTQVSATRPCILGSGGGVAVRVGWRSAGPWYFGGAYELSKQDPNKLYRLAILQQLRGEVRYYFPTGWDTTPFVQRRRWASRVYGNEWSVDTWGPSGVRRRRASRRSSRDGPSSASRSPTASCTSRRSPIHPGTARDAGLAQIVGLDLQLEARDPL